MRLAFDGLLASTNKIFALGAKTCDHSTSNDVSTPQPPGPLGSGGGKNTVLPVCDTFLKLGGSGNLNPFLVQYASKAFKSARIVGASYASMIAIFCPAPSPVIWSRPYACRICAGVRPDGLAD